MKRSNWAVIAVAITASGCAPLMVQQEAGTLDPGRMQVGGAIGGQSETIKGPSGLGLGSSSDSVVPMPLGWVRRGLGAGVDGGLRFYAEGLGADVKYAPIHTQALSIAIAGGGGVSWQDLAAGEGIGGDVESAWEADAALLATFGLGSLPVTGGLRAVRVQEHQHGAGTNTIDYLGGVAGVTLHAGQLAIHPEIAIYQSDYQESGTPDPRGVIVLPSIGFSSSF